jgi:mono/diheme cytochrome c family protein
MNTIRKVSPLIAVLAFGSGCDNSSGPTPTKAQPTKASKPAAKPPEEKKPAEPKVDPAVLERGRYLTDVVMNCKACHTPLGPQGPDMSKAFAGGLEITESFGTWRSPNITQDKRTGIGGWTDEQIIAAIREGKRPTGEQMYPIMPYLFFNKLSDDDAKAVVAYLRTIKPIEHAVAGTEELKLPKIPAPATTGTAPGEEPLQQGEYLATLMHCGQCHTPFNKEGTPDMDKWFAGGFEFEAPPALGTGKVWSSNLTPDEKTGIGKYTDEELITGFTKMTKRDGSKIVGPMVFYAAWAALEPEHATQVVTYMRSLKPVKNKIRKPTWKDHPRPAEPGAEAKAEKDAPAKAAPKKVAPKGDAAKTKEPAKSAKDKPAADKKAED